MKLEKLEKELSKYRHQCQTYEVTYRERAKRETARKSKQTKTTKTNQHQQNNSKTHFRTHLQGKQSENKVEDRPADLHVLCYHKHTNGCKGKPRYKEKLVIYRRWIPTTVWRRIRSRFPVISSTKSKRSVADKFYQLNIFMCVIKCQATDVSIRDDTVAIEVT